FVIALEDREAAVLEVADELGRHCHFELAVVDAGVLHPQKAWLVLGRSRGRGRLGFSNRFAGGGFSVRCIASGFLGSIRLLGSICLGRVATVGAGVILCLLGFLLEGLRSGVIEFGKRGERGLVGLADTVE